MAAFDPVEADAEIPDDIEELSTIGGRILLELLLYTIPVPVRGFGLAIPVPTLFRSGEGSGEEGTEAEAELGEVGERVADPIDGVRRDPREAEDERTEGTGTAGRSPTARAA